jgi:hypothetical protein
LQPVEVKTLNTVCQDGAVLRKKSTGELTEKAGSIANQFHLTVLEPSILIAPFLQGRKGIVNFPAS